MVSLLAVGLIRVLIGLITADALDPIRGPSAGVAEASVGRSSAARRFPLTGT